MQRSQLYFVFFGILLLTDRSNEWGGSLRAVRNNCRGGNEDEDAHARAPIPQRFRLIKQNQECPQFHKSPENNSYSHFSLSIHTDIWIWPPGLSAVSMTFFSLLKSICNLMNLAIYMCKCIVCRRNTNGALSIW